MRVQQLKYPYSFSELWEKEGYLNKEIGISELIRLVDPSHYLAINEYKLDSSGRLVEEKEIWLTEEGYKQFRLQRGVPATNLDREKQIQSKLARSLNGDTEVKIETGRIDVLTKEEIIEVKTVKDWKHAIGQVLVYSVSYPTLKKRIHLFGHASKELKWKIEFYCKRLNIQVTFED